MHSRHPLAVRDSPDVRFVCQDLAEFGYLVDVPAQGIAYRFVPAAADGGVAVTKLRNYLVSSGFPAGCQRLGDAIVFYAWDR